jgi:hypothetical protein
MGVGSRLEVRHCHDIHLENPICASFNDAVSSSGYIVSNDGMINKLEIKCREAVLA